MSSNSDITLWHPARFTVAGPKYNHKINKSYAIIILNQPLENKQLLVKLCSDYGR